MLAKAYRSTVAALLEDHQDASPARVALVRRASAIITMLDQADLALISGKPFDLSTYVVGTNTLTRLLAALGIDRDVKRGSLTLDDYLEMKSKVEDQ